MRIQYLLFFIGCLMLSISCKRDTYDNSIDGFSQLESDLIQRFGEGSYFTDITILQNNEEELEVDLLVTQNPYSYTMEGWNYKNGDWQKITEVDLELVRGDIVNYLYTINQEVSIVKMKFLIESCIKKAKEKGYTDIAFNKVIILSPNDGDKLKMGYYIQIIADNKKINYVYTLAGDLVKDNVL